MRRIAEVIKRLYQKGELSQEKLKERVEKGTLTEDEFREITGSVEQKSGRIDPVAGHDNKNAVRGNTRTVYRAWLSYICGGN